MNRQMNEGMNDELSRQGTLSALRPPALPAYSPARTAPATVYLCWVPRSHARPSQSSGSSSAAWERIDNGCSRRRGGLCQDNKGHMTAVGASFLLVNTVETVIRLDRPLTDCHFGRPGWAYISCEMPF